MDGTAAMFAQPGMFIQPRVRKTAPPPPKKRKVQHAVEEVTFDRTAREEYLTGFHKRKLERKRHAQQIAEQKAREERIETRKQIREERKQALEEHVQTIQQILREAEAAGTGTAGKDGEEDEEWGGLSDDEVVEAPIDMEEEYIDEDKYTTVTVEAVSVDRDGLHKPKAVSSDDDEESKTEKLEDEDKQATKGAKRPKEQKKKKKFRYETKFDRQLTERKQKAKKRKARGVE